jgi:uncharacterized protein YecE (DUF72 family)
MADLKPGEIRVGIGGWTYEPWRGAFYPEKHPQKRELEFASRAVSTIEINGTYYGAQKPESFGKWFSETPEDFVFSVKAPRYATNRKVLAEAGETIDRFLSGGLMELGQKLGPINWQFMATKAFDPADFEAFLKLLPKSADGRALRHVVEVRHDSFRCEEFVAMVRRYNVAVVTALDSDFPVIAEATAPFVYVRMMGTQEGEPLGYSEAALDATAERARVWALGGIPIDMPHFGSTTVENTIGRDVFLYIISGHKVANPLAAQAVLSRVQR